MEHLVWDVAQNARIRRNAIDVSEARRRAGTAVRAADELEEEVDRLTLICHAMWEVLQDQLGLSDAQLLEKIREVDLRSGRQDGKAPAKPATCPSCSRISNARHALCIYCGVELRNNPFGG